MVPFRHLKLDFFYYIVLRQSGPLGASKAISFSVGRSNVYPKGTTPEIKLLKLINPGLNLWANDWFKKNFIKWVGKYW